MTDELMLNELRSRATILARLAREEDLGAGDVTAALNPRPDEPLTARLIARQPGVLAGREIAHQVLAVYSDQIEMCWRDGIGDGTHWNDVPSELAVLRGMAGDVLAAERVLLNFLQRLCGIATLTREFVDAVAGTGAAIFDTRKTTPGWRALEKYAVRCGGGCNHRMGLYDAVLIKDNHIVGVSTERLAGHVFGMLNALAARNTRSNVHDHGGPRFTAGLSPRPGEARGERPSFIAVEADTLEQVEALLTVVGIDVILLDNFLPAKMRQAVELRDRRNLRGKVALEASGGITLHNVRTVAATGVERISVGAITHSAPAIDLALERTAE
ncbi:MAG: nicotinate-nucleotide diphosphorylase [Phycisphaerales bacterium]|nr:nicotinate-nucleotide diphosphorylase [Phycisphaerales bacterium]